MVANGETPKWDMDSKKWVSKTSTGEATVGEDKKINPEPEIADPQADATTTKDDDLPF